MSNEQPEALRLAEWLEHHLNHYRTRHENFIQAAAELRRLHVLNQELVEALEELEAYVRTEHICGPKTNIYLDKARAAIAKAKGESNEPI